MKTKTRPIYVMGFLLAGGFLVWLATLVPSGQQPDTFPVTLDGPSTQPAERTPAESDELSRLQTDAGPSIGGEDSAPSSGRPEAPPGLYFEYLRKAYSHPLDFYGKVVDQDGIPVAGAEVNFTWASPPPNERGHNAVKQSDAEGLFSLTGAVGRLLGVRVSKKSYYFPDGQRIGFNYAPEEENFKADPRNPIVFRLKKRGPGVELVTSQYGVNSYLGVSAPKDGTPVWVDFFERKVGGTGQMQVSKLTPTLDRSERVPKEWRVTLTIPDGGFVGLTDEQFPFYPPETGYEPMLDFHFLPEREGWANRISGKYYIAFGNPRRYGHIKLNVNIAGSVRLEYVVNPDGRPYLEPKEVVIE